MKSAEIINRYVFAVGERLPQKSRADIQAELKSLLQESLDARSESEGRPVDEAMTAAVLREFGDPETVAARYVPTRPLISTTTYPTFVTVSKIVLTILSIVYLVGLVIRLAQPDGMSEPIGTVIWDSIWGYVGAMLANFGLLVVIFAGIDRLPNWSVADEKEEWNPLKLPAVEDPNRLDRSDAITTIVVNVIILAFFNFAPNLPGFVFIENSTVETLPLFGPAFAQYLPWIFLSCIIEIVLYGYVLIRGHWSRVTRLAEIGSGLFAAFILWRILTDGMVIAAIPAFDPLFKIGIGIALIIVLIDVGLNTFRLITRRWNSDKASGLELAAI